MLSVFKVGSLKLNYVLNQGVHNMEVSRPHFVRAWSLFSEINVPVVAVGEKIGGFVKKILI